jgi:K+ transporter
MLALVGTCMVIGDGVLTSAISGESAIALPDLFGLCWCVV